MFFLLLYFHCPSGLCCTLLFSLCTWADLLSLSSCVDSNKITETCRVWNFFFLLSAGSRLSHQDLAVFLTKAWWKWKSWWVFALKTWSGSRESRRLQSSTVYWQCVSSPGLLLLFVKLWEELGHVHSFLGLQKAFKDSPKKAYAGLWK